MPGVTRHWCTLNSAPEHADPDIHSLRELIADAQKTGRQELSQSEIALTSQISGLTREIKSLHEMVQNNRRDIVSLLRNQNEIERSLSILTENIRGLTDRLEKQERRESPTRPLSEEGSPRYALKKLTPRKPIPRAPPPEEPEKRELDDSMGRLYLDKDGMMTKGSEL